MQSQLAFKPIRDEFILQALKLCQPGSSRFKPLGHVRLNFNFLSYHQIMDAVALVRNRLEKINRALDVDGPVPQDTIDATIKRLAVELE